jgi:hypothetical protein
MHNKYIYAKQNVMYKYLFRFCVMTVTILTANLLTETISDYLVSYRNHLKPLTFTLLGMVITVAIFYPLFIKLEVWVKNLSMRMIKAGKSFKGKYAGLLISFFASLFVLTYFYAKMWYNIDILRVMLNGNANNII